MSSHRISGNRVLERMFAPKWERKEGKLDTEELNGLSSSPNNNIIFIHVKSKKYRTKAIPVTGRGGL
jgi:hypothetical protein